MAVIKEDEETQPGQDRSGISAPGPLQTVGTAAPTGGAMATPEKRPQGSGRFTNLQKYIQANQGAGQRIAGQVGRGVQEKIGKEQQEAQDYYSQLGRAVTAAQDVARQGQQYTGQLRDIGGAITGAGYQAPQVPEGQMAPQATMPIRQQEGLGAIQSFVDDPGFRQFQEIQAGRGINEQLLGLRQAQATREAQEALGTAQQAQEALGTAGGRFELLKQTFGGARRPGYTTGQQRLDQALMAQAGLGGVRQDVGQQIKTGLETVQGTGKLGGQVGTVTAQEQAIMGDIGDQARANEQAYLDMLQTYVDPTQAARESQWQQLEESVQSFRPQEPTEGEVGTTDVNIPRFTQEQMERLGVTGGQGVYNVFDDIMSAQDIAAKGREAQTAQDIATQTDVDRYAALANIMGASPEERRLYQPSTLNEAYASLEGPAGLGDRLGAAQTEFERLAGQQAAMGWSPGGTTYTAQATLQDILDQGQGAIEDIYGGAAGSGFRGAQLDRGYAHQYLLEQAKDLAQEQNYRQLLGGDTRTTAVDDVADWWRDQFGTFTGDDY